MVSCIATECKHDCMDRMVQQLGGLRQSIEFVALQRDKYHTMHARSGEDLDTATDSGGQWILDRFRTIGVKPGSPFPHGMEVTLGPPWTLRSCGPFCVDCMALVLCVNPPTINSSLKKATAGHNQYKVQQPRTRRQRVQNSGVTGTSQELVVRAYLEDVFMPLYAQQMPTKDQHWELHPLERKLVAGWCVEYLQSVNTPRQLIPKADAHGFNPVVQRVWNSSWFDHLKMRKALEVASECHGHDCGDSKCPQRHGCTSDGTEFCLPALRAKAFSRRDLTEVVRLEVLHANMHTEDRSVYMRNCQAGADECTNIISWLTDGIDQNCLAAPVIHHDGRGRSLPGISMKGRVKMKMQVFKQHNRGDVIFMQPPVGRCVHACSCLLELASLTRLLCGCLSSTLSKGPTWLPL